MAQESFMYAKVLCRGPNFDVDDRIVEGTRQL